MSRGFTLIELMVVLAIAALVLAIVPPMFSGGISAAELSAAARDVAAGLRYARSRAVTRADESVFLLNTQAGIYHVEGTAKRRHLPSGVEARLYTASSELQGDRLGGIRFFADGSSTGGRVTLAHGSTQYEVEVEWISGQVRIRRAEATL